MCIERKKRKSNRMHVSADAVLYALVPRYEVRQRMLATHFS